jgi:hypothetical protein
LRLWGVVKQSVAVNIMTATTTSIVTVSGSTKVFVCGFTFSMTGTTPTFQFEYGTGAACTNPVVLTGTFQADITAVMVNKYVC